MTATAQSQPAAASGGRRLRVLMLVNNIRRGGGAERTMVALATNLPPDRFEVMVATTRSEVGPLLDKVYEAGIPHLALNRRGRLDLAPFRRLVAFLREERIDVLHAHMFGSNLWGSLFGRLAGVPAIVAHEHSWAYRGKPWRRFLDGYVIGRLADVFVAVSERDRRRMIEWEGVPAEKIRVLPNPYVPRPSAERVDIRRQLGLADDVPLVGTVAVLRPEKALDVLIEAVARLTRTMPDAHLVIAGEGQCREELGRCADELGVADRVHFLGWCEDVAGLLESIDVAAMCSDREGAPLFAIECMAHRVPLVSTDVGNVSDLLTDGVGVTLVPRRDPDALADALAALLGDPARRQAQADAAAGRFEDFELDAVIGKFSELYEELVARASARRRTALTRRPSTAN
jgi:glycosyltransferase involved in cell wall biosynthesis